jgi:ParB-like chromosome segregation protein Spo0J
VTAQVEQKPVAEVSATTDKHDRTGLMSGFEHLPETDVMVSSLVPGFYLRQAGTDSTHIRLLVDAAGAVKLPPILVQKNGCRIIDGMHRVEAAKLRGEATIRARVLDCSDEEALVLAIKTNIQHGLPLSKADRISGAKRILAAHLDWSDRAVAEIAGLSAKTIASLRNRTTTEAQAQGKRLGRDGKRRPLSAAEGRRRAAEYIDAHPEASLREVAREADVSLGTVHDVRERLRRGSDPVRGERERSSADGAAKKNAEPAGLRAADRPSLPPPSTLRARTVRTNIQQLDWPTIAARLAGDPALKYTEGGRAFLRWMSAHSTKADEWQEFIDAIPMHWLKDVSRVAETVSAEWRDFAERLRNRQAAAS